ICNESSYGPRPAPQANRRLHVTVPVPQTKALSHGSIHVLQLLELNAAGTAHAGIFLVRQSSAMRVIPTIPSLNEGSTKALPRSPKRVPGSLETLCRDTSKEARRRDQYMRRTIGIIPRVGCPRARRTRG